MKRFALIIFFTVYFIGGFAQTSEKEAITKAIRTGDSKKVASYFLPSVDLTVVSVEDVYSRDQAEMIVQRFFERNSPSEFNLKHEGKSKLDDYYYIGSLKTDKGNYRLTFFLKKGDQDFRIKQFRIESED